MEAAAAGERWVIDGNYSVAREVIWARATAVVWLNYALARVAWRAVRRTVGRALSGEELYAGNRESLRTAFLSRDSIIWWAVSTFGSRRRRYRALFDSRDFPHLTMIELHRPADADAFWRRVEAGCRNTLDGE